MRRPKGSGCIYRVGKQWRGYKTISGQRVYTGVHQTKQEVQKELDGLTSATIRAEFLPTLSEWYQSLLEGPFRREYEEPTWKLHEGMWRLRVAPSDFGRMRLDQVKRRHVQSFIDKAADVYRSAWSIRRLGSCVHTALERAVRDELIPANPATGIKYPKIPETPLLRLSPEQALQLPNMPEDKRLAAMLLVGLDTGLRRGEICGLKWDAINEEERYIVVKNQRVRRDGTMKDKLPKGGKTGIVDLTDAALAVLLSQPRRSEYVFTTATGNAVRPDDVTRDMRRFRKEAGIGEIRIKDLRSNFVSMLLETGADIRTVQELARHSSSKTTQEIYARSRRDLKRAAIDRLQNRGGSGGSIAQ